MSLLLVAVAMAGCATRTFVDHTSSIVVGGAHYTGGPANGYEIEPSDLTPLEGIATEIKADVAGTTVYRLHAVDPQAVVVMQAGNSTESPYWIFFHEGVIPESETQSIDWTFPTIPGLCGYLEQRPEGCS